ncbi:hypothetical protein MNVI_19940 [Mycobacterium noviomagense]|uniref:Uncharacterized protein n=1 Tax=Mycobacterium noviomagense TaxID=459858 RepID=A0A7I7PDQ6_9MYCO|nr:hypothetical protein MNVI_19940 [Mycobacterium noviomagense]
MLVLGVLADPPCDRGPLPTVFHMDIAQDIKGFLVSRRARITPEQVGLPAGRRRRVPGCGARKSHSWPA